MYKTIKIQVKQASGLYPYCGSLCRLSNNLYNASLFRYRQAMTARNKTETDLTDNEREVMKEMQDTLPHTKREEVPETLTYCYLDSLYKVTKNPDYYSEGLPRQSAQAAMKQMFRDMKGYFEAMHAYRVSPDIFLRKPELPHYKHKGGMCTAILSNQDCCIRYNEKNEKYYAKLPLTKETLKLGRKVPGTLKEVKVVPENGIFVFAFSFDDGISEVPLKAPERICAIDPGVNNLMAVTNNCGLPTLLYKGGAVKSINQRYNKKMAEIQSRETAGTTKKFVPTQESQRITVKRNNAVNDFMLKASRSFITWCVDNRIDTVVIGSNRMWKQEPDMNKRSNQNFLQIPFDRLKQMITYMARYEGIRVIKREESYTSLSSYLDRDPLPELDGQKHHFSGVRFKRGLYRSSDGTVLNADMNGSANIMRKEFPSLSEGIDFSHMIVIRHPDGKKQHPVKKENISHARYRRESRKSFRTNVVLSA
jgi:putative transposase